MSDKKETSILELKQKIRQGIVFNVIIEAFFDNSWDYRLLLK